MTDGPHRISDREVPISITGHFMPLETATAPVLIGMPGTDDLFIFVFSTAEKLTAVMTSLGIEYAHVAVVTDELLDEIGTMNESGDRPYRIRLAVDPHKADNGHMRFTEAVPSETPPASVLSTMKHADGCQVTRENGVAVWMCSGACPAMAEFIASGQVYHQPWEQLDRDQCETVIEAVSKHALAGLDTRDAEGKNKP